ncbi:hypothetical protein Tco_0534760 [Tanacetum coccineum]
MKQATRKTEVSSDLSGKDHTNSQKHWTEECISLETVMEIPFREHEISATLRNAMCTKCKHPLHARKSERKGNARIFFICNWKRISDKRTKKRSQKRQNRARTERA